MNDLSIFPADIAEMSVSQLANLPAQQLVEVDTNLDQAIAWLKTDLSRSGGALPSLSGAAREPCGFHGGERRHHGDLHRARAL